MAYRNNRAYGLENALQNLAPQPVAANRAPLGTDINYAIGTTWVDQPNQAVYVLVAYAAGAAVWTTSPASGVGAFTAVTVNPGDIDVTAGDVNIALGNLVLTAGNATVGGDLTVAGTTTINGDFDLTSAALIDLTSTLNAAPSILLHANGGVNEAIEIYSDQGTAVDSIFIHSDVGGIRLYAPNLANAAAIDLQADSGGLDVDVALQLSLHSTQNAADAIDIQATAGGIQIISAGAAGEDIVMTASSSIILTSTEDASSSIYLHANGGVTEQILIHSELGTAEDAVFLVSDVGGITLEANLASADAMNISAPAGGIDIDGALQVNIASSQNAASAIVINASAGGIDITSTSGGAGEDIDIVCTGGSVNITGSEAVADAITIQSSNAAGGIDISSGTGDTDITSTGNINLVSTLDAAQNIYIRSNGGTTDTLQLHADQGSGLTSLYLLSDDGGIKLESGTIDDASITLLSGGGIGLTTAAGGPVAITTFGAGNVTVEAATNSAAGVALTLDAHVGQATFTGQTTAAGAQEAFTITNALVSATSMILVTVANVGTNDARMTLEQVKPAAGSFVVNTQNNGAAALNGDVMINFWVLETTP